jgi:hypothetical protein
MSWFSNKEKPAAAAQRIADELAATQARIASAREEAAGLTDAVARRAILKRMASDKDELEILEQDFETAKQAVAKEESVAATAADDARRAADAKIDTALADEGPAVRAEFEAAGKKLTAWCQATAPRVPEGQALLNWCSITMIEPPAAIELVTTLLRNRARDVVAKRIDPVTTPHEQAVARAAQSELTPTHQVFATKKLKWHAEGRPEWHTCCQLVDVTLPIKVAERAVKIGAALPFGSAEVQKLRELRAPTFPVPHSDHCVDCDPIGAVITKGTPLPRKGAAVSSTFDPNDVKFEPKPGRTNSTAFNPVPAQAARSNKR